MEKIKAVIFDMDGVIFDSERLYMQCCKEAARIFGIRNIESTVISCIGLNTEKTHELYRNTYGADFPIDEYWKEVTGRFAEKAQGGLLPVKSGAENLLKYLRKKNIPIALASSTKTEIIMRELNAAGLTDYFDIIIGGNMVKKSKPDPDIFLLAADKLGYPTNECIIIEDSFNGVRAASAAGAYVIMVPDIAVPDAEMENLADNIFDSLINVKDFFVKEVFGEE